MRLRRCFNLLGKIVCTMLLIWGVVQVSMTYERLELEGHTSRKTDVPDYIQQSYYPDIYADASYVKVYTHEENSWRRNWTVCDRVNTLTFKLVPIVVPNKPTIGIYILDPEKDEVSRIVAKTNKFEYKMFNEMYHIFGGDPSVDFIDIGANLGMHAIIMAEFGKRVFAMEMSPDRVKRMCASTAYNMLKKKVTIIHNALGRKSKNQIITLDHVLSNPEFKYVKQIFIKISVSKLNDEVLEGSTKFFKHIEVKGVYLEWKNNEKDEMKGYIIELMHARGFEAFICENLPFDVCTKLVELHLMKRISHILWLPKGQYIPKWVRKVE